MKKALCFLSFIVMLLSPAAFAEPAALMPVLTVLPGCGQTKPLPEIEKDIRMATLQIASGEGVADALMVRGIAQGDKGEHEKAIADFTRVISMKPSAEAFFNRAFDHEAMESWDLALADYNSALRLDRYLADAYAGRGRVLRELKRDRLALGDFTHAVRLDPGYADAYAERAYTFSLAGDHVRALKDYDRAVALSSNDACLRNERGIENEEAGFKTQALTDYSAAVEIRPDLAVAWANKGHLNAEMGNPAAALADYDRAVKADPQDARTYEERAQVHFKQGHYIRGWMDQSRAKSLAAAQNPV